MNTKELEKRCNELFFQVNEKTERIAELEKENAELRNNGFTVSAMTEQQLKFALEKGEQLEKENAELKKKCYKKAVKDYCELEKENVELKNKIRFMGEQIDNLKAIAKYDQLTKAKELLKQWLQTSKASGCDNINIVTDTEQFLNSEV